MISPVGWLVSWFTQLLLQNTKWHIGGNEPY